jgi:serine O-acetyltransferase
MFEIIRKDIEAYQRRIGGTRARQRIEVFRSPGIHSVIVYRFGRWLLDRSMPIRILLDPLYFLLYHRMRAKWGIEIWRQARIGEGFIVQHFGSVFVGSTVIGKNFIVHQDVTVGLILEGIRRGMPQIGDNVTIAPGAKVFGKITIGNNVKIGPNAVVLKSVPDNAIVTVHEPRAVIFPEGYNVTDAMRNTKPISTTKK